MADAKDVILAQLESGQMILDMFTKDLTDAEYYEPPMAGGNHTAWVLGHLACTEDWAVGAIAGSGPRLPQATHKLFNGQSTCVAESSKYPPPNDLEEMFRNARAHTVEILKAFDDRKWDDPAPEGVPREFFPTMGAVWGMQATHQFWHIGHVSACRTALGKPRQLT